MSAAAERRRIQPGEEREGEPLARYTTWRVGGPARRLFCPRDGRDLSLYLARQPAGEPLLWCGLGSNLLVRDGGWPGTVILPTGGLDGLAIEGHRVRAEAGLPVGRLARATLGAGLEGLAFLAGIPGTVGGALAMNAAAYGGATWDRIAEVETIDGRGQRRRRPPGDFAVGYRGVQAPPGEAFLAGTWALDSGDAAALRDWVRTMLRQRNASQPVGQRTCGSVFRNPPGDAAGRLIDSAGLKGARCGGACVSERHANFILNEDATAAELEGLIADVRERVEACHGVRLEREVHIVGVAPP